MYCCDLFSVCLIVVVAVVLTAFMPTLFCLLQVGTSEDGSLVILPFVVVVLLVWIMFLFGLALVHCYHIIVSVIVRAKNQYYKLTRAPT